VTGSSLATSNSPVYATLAYSGTGEALWTNLSGIPGGATAMAVDRNGNLLITGSSLGTIGYDCVTIKYSSSLQAPRLNFQNLNEQVVLSWTNAGFTLQATPVVSGTFTNIPAATTPFTNTLTATQQFFRLIQN